MDAILLAPVLFPDPQGKHKTQAGFLLFAGTRLDDKSYKRDIEASLLK